jgi:pantoate--beta-alanine ligase
MILYRRAADIHAHLQSIQNEGKKIGFAPTMGALHPGHISLLELSKTKTDITVASIFVNPTQFNDPQDYAKYPVTTDNDLLLLEQAGCDFVFLPDVAEIYPQGTGVQQHYPIGALETLLEGKYRPGHFQGVCQVVHRLLDIIHPDHLYMGRKDYQQCMVVAEHAAFPGTTGKSYSPVSITQKNKTPAYTRQHRSTHPRCSISHSGQRF